MRTPASASVTNAPPWRFGLDAPHLLMLRYAGVVELMSPLEESR
jgi:hypothetical protein